MKDFNKKIMEARVRQSNIKWLTKEIILGIVGAFILYIIFFAK